MERFKIIDASTITTDAEPYIIKTVLNGLYIVQRPFNKDYRGTFQELSRQEASRDLMGPFSIEQTQLSTSLPGVLRGIHAEPQVKVITPILGQLMACIVDLNPTSETFGKYQMINFDVGVMSPRTTLVLKPGLGNSLLVTGDEPVIYGHGVSSVYDPKNNGRGVRFDDPKLGIEWPSVSGGIIISDRDRDLPTLDGFIERYYD